MSSHNIGFYGEIRNKLYKNYYLCEILNLFPVKTCENVNWSNQIKLIDMAEQTCRPTDLSSLRDLTRW